MNESTNISTNVTVNTTSTDESAKPTRILSAANPRFTADGRIMLDVQFTDIDGTFPFIAAPDDLTGYGPELHARALAGEFGEVAAYVPPPPPTAEEVTAQITAEKTRLVQAKMDAQAQTLGYDDIATAVTYADEPAVPKFQIEGQALRAWRSQVWATCYTILAAVSAGEREIPSDDELIAALPAFEMPAEDATTQSAAA